MAAPAGRWARLVAHEEPTVRAGNTLALILASNQPSYPLWLWLAVGGPWWRAWVVLAAVPLFLAVPPLSRRAPLAGRILLVLTCIGNVVLASLVLGSEAGLRVLLLPCAGIAAALFRRQEQAAMLGAVGLSMLAWLALGGRPAGLFDAAQYAAMARLNALSALAVFAILGLVAGGGRLR